jgi:hypothetical protein
MSILLNNVVFIGKALDAALPSGGLSRYHHR